MASALIALPFGIIYGMLLSSWQSIRRLFEVVEENSIVRNKLFSFMTGHWHFQEKCKNVVLYIAIYLIFAGVLLGGIAMGASAAISNIYGQYFVQTIGYLLFGISLGCFIPLALVKCEVINLTGGG